MEDIKSRMKALGLKQCEMIVILKERGIKVSRPMFSDILMGTYPYKKADEVRAECLKILDEREKAL